MLNLLKGRVLVAPSLAHQVNVGLHSNPFREASLVVAECVAAVKDHFRYAFRVASGVSDSNRGSLRYAKKRVRAQT